MLGPPDEFEIAVDGESGDEYLLDTLGLRDGNIVLEDSISKTLEEAPANLQLTLDEAVEFVIDVVKAVEEEAAEGVAEGAEEAAEGAGEVAEETGAEAESATEESTGPSEWLEDNWWVPAAGGALTLGAGYRYFTRQPQGDNGT